MTDVIPLPPRTPNRARAAILFAALLIASALVGAAVDRFLLAPREAILGDRGFHPLSTMLRSPTEAERRQIRGELARKLKLDARQDSLIAAIMHRNAGQFENLRSEMRPRVEALLAQVRVQVDSVLTPAQREQFHQLQMRDAAGAADTSR